MYNCNCESFQNKKMKNPPVLAKNKRKFHKRIRQKTRKFMKPILRENLKNPEFRKKFQTDPKFRKNFLKK